MLFLERKQVFLSMIVIWVEADLSGRQQTEVREWSNQPTRLFKPGELLAQFSRFSAGS